MSICIIYDFIILARPRLAISRFRSGPDLDFCSMKWMVLIHGRCGPWYLVHTSKQKLAILLCYFVKINFIFHRPFLHLSVLIDSWTMIHGGFSGVNAMIAPYSIHEKYQFHSRFFFHGGCGALLSSLLSLNEFDFDDLEPERDENIFWRPREINENIENPMIQWFSTNENQ